MVLQPNVVEVQAIMILVKQTHTIYWVCLSKKNTILQNKGNIHLNHLINMTQIN